MKKLATFGLLCAFVISCVSCEAQGGKKNKKMNSRSKAQIENAAKR